jgi:hypothetical protein
MRTVETAVDGTAIQARHFHVVPQNKNMAVADGVYSSVLVTARNL